MCKFVVINKQLDGTQEKIKYESKKKVLQFYYNLLSKIE